MPRFLITIYRPNDFDPAGFEDPSMVRDIDALNDEMVAAGVRIYVGGLQPAGRAKSLRRGADGVVRVSDGPCVKAGEFMDGLWVIEADDLEEAVAWGRKAAAACRALVEVRAFY